MSNSLQEPWKLSESERIINNWLRSCETDPSTTNLFERNQHYKAALDEVRRLRPRSQSLPGNFMDNGNQRVRNGRDGESGVTTRSQGRKSRFNKSLKEYLSTTTSELNFRTPTTLSRSTIFTAATKLTSASRNYRLQSRSPTKRISDLRAAKPPIEVEAAIRVPQDVKVLWNRFIDIQDSIGVLPRYLQNQLNALDDREYRDIFFNRSAHPNNFSNSDSKATVHTRELLKELLSI
ncbi:uncharacterized protein K441DRAFT_664838 [Cenococcum geophilum 1.58]|uniref:uncharacterized protein n=1 Tax=Cenococcum geophilum 1.58 TaxID=794803 RepID=UPI00358E5BCA|nr:hypothetical protein K441DRAFT_664838 [Cenococcum geophilum 1.58]